MTRLPILTLAVLSIAACNKQGGERQQAAGEILEGSVSDAMIQTEQLRSEGPYAAPKAAKEDKGGKAGVKPAVGASAQSDATESAAPDVPAPTPTPTASATPTPETSG
jgi:hypothetical protein